MRTRAKINKVSDLVRDPDMRIVFQKEHHTDFMKLISIGEEYSINPTTLSRHLVLIFIRKMNNATDKQAKDRIITEIMQSIHGLSQIDIFQKKDEWENIEIPRQPAALIRKAKPKPGTRKPKPKKKGGAKK